MSNQGTAEWLLERLGHASASRFADILAVSAKGVPLKSREDYLMQLVTERLYKRPTESASSQAMQWGKESEPLARTAYEVETGVIVIESDFVKHPTIPFVGCSPDGLIGTKGGYESKCPANSAVHMATWRDGMPKAHVAQVQGCMWVVGREWWDFVSYDPRATPDFRLYIERIARNEKYIATLEAEVIKFLADVEAQIITITTKAA
ncbi:lambda exonuclease family protein [Massilia sp. CCM 8734]|uniref:lambda exonuclease family protein n=1 Tax=Massilia sp. CCM 8734 TaxID=2609283 RepID=UPI001422D3D3|nr:lambda exonuclease family protein [Massilia sp. CCM 8734]NHZ94627.1 exonuclease [Massilia sp. CCM 8734]